MRTLPSSPIPHHHPNQTSGYRVLALPFPPATLYLVLGQLGPVSRFSFMSSPGSHPSSSSSPSTRLFSLERVTTLLVSVLVALCSGTNYVRTRSNTLWMEDTYYYILLSKVYSGTMHPVSREALVTEPYLQLMALN